MVLQQVGRLSKTEVYPRLSLMSSASLIQHKPNLTGDFLGSLGPLQLKLHLHSLPEGSLAGSLDSITQGAISLECSEFQYDGGALSFAVPSVHGSWKGSVSADGKSLDGTWTQRAATPLRFTRDPFVPAAKPSRIDGIWLGTLHAAGQDLRVQLTVRSDASGHEFCSLDSIDQHAFGLECTNAVLSVDEFSFDIPVIDGHWNGKISPDGKTFLGVWTQRGSALNLEFARQSTAQGPAPISYDRRAAAGRHCWFEVGS